MILNMHRICDEFVFLAHTKVASFYGFSLIEKSTLTIHHISTQITQTKLNLTIHIVSPSSQNNYRQMFLWHWAHISCDQLQKQNVCISNKYDLYLIFEYVVFTSGNFSPCHLPWNLPFQQRQQDSGRSHFLALVSINSSTEYFWCKLFKNHTPKKVFISCIIVLTLFSSFKMIEVARRSDCWMNLQGMKQLKNGQSPFPQLLNAQNIFQVWLNFCCCSPSIICLLQWIKKCFVILITIRGWFSRVILFRHILFILPIHWSLDKTIIHWFWVLLNVILNITHCSCCFLFFAGLHYIGKEMIGRMLLVKCAL